MLGENALYGTGHGSGDGVHPNAGKTGTTERPRRRLVRRLHARLLDGRLDGLSARRDPDARRARPGRRRRDVPGADLAPVHGGGREGPPGEAVPDARAPTRCSRRSPAATGATSPSRSRPHDDDHDDHDARPSRRRPSPTEVNPTRERSPAPPSAHPLAGLRSPERGRRGDELLSIDEALELVLERVVPLEAEDVPLDEAAGRVLAEPRRCGGRPAAVPGLGDGRLRAPRCRRARRRCRSSRGSPPGGPWPRRSRPARRWRSRPAASCPDGRRLGRADRGRRGARRRRRRPGRASPRARTCGRAAAISRAGDPVVGAGVRARPGASGRARRRRRHARCACAVSTRRPGGDRDGAPLARRAARPRRDLRRERRDPRHPDRAAPARRSSGCRR